MIPALIGYTLLFGVVWAADAEDASVRYIARSRWGFGAFACGLACIVAGVLA